MKPGAFIAAAGAAALFFAWHAHAYWTLRRQLKAAPLTVRSTKPDAQSGLETALAQAARLSKIQKLLSVNSVSEQETKLEWEADLNSTAAFLRCVTAQKITGPCLKLELSPDQAAHAQVRARAVFQKIGASMPTTIAVPERSDALRAVFAAPWNRRRENTLFAQPRDPKKEQQAQEKERLKAEEEHLKAAEVERVEAKKRELESQLVVTGIVNNGREALAFVNNRGSDRTLMIKRGDTLQEARVDLIDEKAGEVRLDYLGKFQVLLRLK